MVKAINNKKIAGSFRDPEGFVFSLGGEIFRQINAKGKANYDQLMSSGLYETLVTKSWLIAHSEVKIQAPEEKNYYKIIKPEVLLFISYPYEWSFSQLKDAALLTLDIQKEAISHGMSLKDSSAYNIQFDVASGKAIFIDTLSFEVFNENSPWSAYRQFCQHFLAPLALMAYSDIRFSQLLRTNIDGIPLDIAWKVLPNWSIFLPGIFTHIYLHSKAQIAYANTKVRPTQRGTRMTKTQHLGILDSLQRTVSRLKRKNDRSEWGKYYTETNYDETAFAHKKSLVNDFISSTKAKFVWDIGGNTGEFSRLASQKGIPTISFDIDPIAIEKNYLTSKRENEPNILPLLLDLTNPSPNLGWNNKERMSIFERRLPDAVLALALIHHLAISNNLPLGHLAQFFSRISPWLIIEFVPKSDSQVQRLFLSRKDIFPDYSKKGFETAFTVYFSIQESVNVRNSERKLYLLKRLNT